MYEWLAHALHDSAFLLTANRRLARTLHAEYGRQRIAAGELAWRTPYILAWEDWLSTALSEVADAAGLPSRITANQSRLLWERCLRREINDPLINIAMLARQASDSWSRLGDWGVSIDTCAKYAVGKDRRLFVRAARGYASIMERENWVDPAGSAALVAGLVEEGRITPPVRMTLAGFDRISPQARSLLDACAGRGSAIETVDISGSAVTRKLYCYDHPDAELRAAGMWARQELERAPGHRIAVVVTNLAQNASRYSRLFREGFVPGWQNAGTRFDGAVNISYGKTLSSYPSIYAALLLLRWLHQDLTSTELGILLRHAAIGTSSIDARSRLDLRLRDIPEQSWTPEMILASEVGNKRDADLKDWRLCVERLAEIRSRLANRVRPAEWATLFDEVLSTFQWPGTAPLDSSEFQLTNRWRELLNELAQLELVTPTMTLTEAYGRLVSLANDTVFQPQAENASVQLLGPLEAAGMEFDAIWIAGLSTRNWPPPGRPLALVARDLQRETGMPDADPQDTLDYAHRVLDRLARSAFNIVLSYATTDDDTEQSMSGLLRTSGLDVSSGPRDPHWNAISLSGLGAPRTILTDPVPAVTGDETVAGGAATLQRQFSEPFSAFAYGRLLIRTLAPFVRGLAANVRGSLIHRALHRLYAELPTSRDIAGWTAAGIENRVADSVRAAFRPLERHADDVLGQLLRLEKQRVAGLLKRVIELDATREPFTVHSVENSVETEIGGLRLQLRYDRVDRIADGEFLILDYKTGTPKRLLGKDYEPNDLQLVTYALAIGLPVAGIGLVNVDSRGVDISAAGKSFSPDLDWDDWLSHWQKQVEVAAAEISAGDIRVNTQWSVQAARPLGLLSRYRERS